MLNITDSLATIEAVEDFIDFYNIQTYSELARAVRHRHKPPQLHTEGYEDWYEWRAVLMQYSGHFERYCKGIKEEGAGQK